MQVVFGFLELKTHAKMSLIVRREGGQAGDLLSALGHRQLSPRPAKIYTDLSYFTCDPVIARDDRPCVQFRSPAMANLKGSQAGGLAASNLRTRIVDNIGGRDRPFAEAGRPAANLD